MKSQVMVGPVQVEQIVPTQWKNGNGLTRELATGPGWRVSIATVTENCLFSRFPRTTRYSVVVRGEALVLHSPDAEFKLLPWVPLSYDGDVEWAAELTAGPVHVLNVMVSVGEAGTRVTTGSGFCIADHHATFLVFAGAPCRWHAEKGESRCLQAGEFLQWDGASHGAVVISSAGDATGHLALVQLGRHITHPYAELKLPR